MELKTFIYEDKPVTFEIGTATMINATEMARPFGKKPCDWLKTEQAQRIIQEIAEVKKIASVENQLITTVKGGNDLFKQGTWFHEDVALEFARWLSPKFAIWCNDRIKELLTKGTVSLPQDYLSALKALVAAEEEKQRLAIENQKMQPKAEYFDALVDRQLLTNFRDTAKEFGMGQNEFVAWLMENKYIYRDKKKQLRPYANAAQLFELKEYKSGNNLNHAGVQTLITPKGRATFKLLLGK